MFDDSHAVGYHSIGPAPEHTDTVAHRILGSTCPCHAHAPVEPTPEQHAILDAMAEEFETVMVDWCPPAALKAILATPCRMCRTCGGDGVDCRTCDGNGSIPCRVPRRITADGDITSPAGYVPID